MTCILHSMIENKVNCMDAKLLHLVQPNARLMKCQSESEEGAGRHSHYSGYSVSVIYQHARQGTFWAASASSRVFKERDIQKMLRRGQYLKIDKFVKGNLCSSRVSYSMLWLLAHLSPYMIAWVCCLPWSKVESCSILSCHACWSALCWQKMLLVDTISRYCSRPAGCGCLNLDPSSQQVAVWRKSKTSYIKVLFCLQSVQALPERWVRVETCRLSI